jgi:hypothetical protein
MKKPISMSFIRIKAPVAHITYIFFLKVYRYICRGLSKCNLYLQVIKMLKSKTL